MPKLVIDAEKRIAKIRKEIYGHFSEHLGRCIYEGIYVGENSSIPNKNGMRCDVVDALKNLKIPVLRWPGGCFADEYHWKDGIGEKASRKKMINTHWGGLVEDNSFGTHEFLELCEQLGCDAYISGNLGSGTVHEMSEWVEYMTFDGLSPMTELRRKNGREKPWKVRYFGVGNENWGCGGNMRPEYYSDLYRQYQTYCRNYSGNELYKIACGPSADDYNWTKTVMELIKPHHTNAISLHYYTIPTNDWSRKGSATAFDEKEYYNTISHTLYMEEMITRHLEIMSEFDREHKIGLAVDEWGTWYDVEPGTNPGFLFQQNTMRDALVAAINLNIFNNHADRVVMANIAQVVNVLQSVVLTEGERMVKTPTYHVFDLFKGHQEQMLVFSSAEKADENGVSVLSCSASVGADGMLVTLSNASLSETLTLDTSISGFAFTSVEGEILTGDAHEHNTFDSGENVAVKAFNGARVTENGIEIVLPPCSVVSLKLK